MTAIAICDDEQYMLSLLAEKISAYMDKTKIEYKIWRFERAEALLASPQTFDLVFLDIQMGAINGIEAAKQLRAKGNNCFLVFVSVLQEYALAAFEVEAANYLLKPVDDGKLYHTLDRIFQRIEIDEKQYLTVKQGQMLKMVKLTDIFYCEVVKRKIYIHTKYGVVDYYCKMEDLEKALTESFFKCHRSYLVNLQYVCKYEAGYVGLENGESISVSRLRQPDFSLAMLSYMRAKGG